MNKDIGYKLWVIKFCLKLIYPKYNYYAFLVFLAIKTRICWKKKLQRMETFSFKSVPSYIVSDFLKDKLDEYSQVIKDKCIILSKEQYIQLCSENLFYLDKGLLWVSMKLSSDSKEKSKKHKVNKQKTSKYNLDYVTSELHKKLWTDGSSNIDNIRIVPVIGSKMVNENIAMVSENEFYNIGSCFETDNIEVTFHPIPCVECAPKIAAYAEVNLIINHYDLTNDFLKEVLNNYFEVPKLLNVNDVICIELTPDVTRKYHYKYLDLIESNGKLYFKCKNLGMELNKKGGLKNLVGAYFIVKGVTQLTISENIHIVKPKDKFVRTPRDNILESCPTGLKHTFLHLQEAITPFLNGEMYNLSSSLSNPIIPMVLLTGHLGSGRHIIVKSLAKYNGINSLPIDCNGLQSSTAKQTESKINLTVQMAKASAPVIVILDNFEVFAVDPENNEDCRVIEYFVSALRDLYENYTKHPIIFIAITEQQDLKPNILRLFLDKFHIPRPSLNQRVEILEWFAKSMQLNIDGEGTETDDITSECRLSKSSEETLKRIAAKTETFLYGDLDTLLHFALRESYLKQCSNNTIDDYTLNNVKEDDFNTALESIRSLQSQNLDAPKIPKVYWEDIGGLDKLKKEILKTIEFPIKYPHLFKNSSLKRSGILMYGPPGCGKTLVAKAVSTELNVSFLSVKGPELLNMYIGQSEENVRRVFSSARASSPCIVFLDELDALAPRRGSAGDSGGASDRLVSQLLAELDGVADTEDSDNTSFVFIMGATNRPDLLEQSLLRPGRLDKLVYVGPYTGLTEKTSVLKALCRNYNLRREVNLETVAAALPERCTGADLMQVVSTARAAAVRDVIQRLHSGFIKESELSPNSIVLGAAELWQGVESFRPSVTDEELTYYESMQAQM